jgi:hypothetical protein
LFPAPVASFRKAENITDIQRNPSLGNENEAVFANIIADVASKAFKLDQTCLVILFFTTNGESEYCHHFPETL